MEFCFATKFWTQKTSPCLGQCTHKKCWTQKPTNYLLCQNNHIIFECIRNVTMAIILSRKIGANEHSTHLWQSQVQKSSYICLHQHFKHSSDAFRNLESTNAIPFIIAMVEIYILRAVWNSMNVYCNRSIFWCTVKLKTDASTGGFLWTEYGIRVFALSIRFWRHSIQNMSHICISLSLNHKAMKSITARRIMCKVHLFGGFSLFKVHVVWCSHVQNADECDL